MIGLLLINLGTPDAPTEDAVHHYLTEFLSDPYVITLPAFLRHFLVKKIILKKRPKKSAEAYQKIWTDQGSPLLINSLALRDALQQQNKNISVALGMRYGNPSIISAIKELQAQQCEKITVLPLFPQFSRATSQSTIDAVYRAFSQLHYHPELKIINDFHDHPIYIDSVAESIAQEKKSDHFLLMSYHGLPKRHADSNCYRDQCYKTSQLLAEKLQLSPDAFSVSFQSRLGFAKWIGPYTDHVVRDLRKQGITNLSVVCTSFVADCIETLEEINIRLRHQWLQLGGQSFQMISCINERVSQKSPSQYAPSYFLP